MSTCANLVVGHLKKRKKEEGEEDGEVCNLTISVYHYSNCILHTVRGSSGIETLVDYMCVQ